jgi:sugar lactone lactonase YvrE
MRAKPRLLVDGLYFGEGPRWRPDTEGGRLWYSDFYARTVNSVSLAGGARVEVTLDDQPSGLGWLPSGDLLIVSMTRRQLLRRDAAGTLHVHADLSDIAGFHCNDMVVDAQGRAYVGNFGFDLDAALRDRGTEGVLMDHPTANLARVDPDGSVHLAAEGLHFPNGSVITPDGRTLIVGETLGGCLTAFDIAADGSLSHRRVWAPTWPRVPDGISLDAAGAVWIANPLAPECVRIGEGGAVLDVIATDMPCFACMLGGPEGKTLFMLTAPTSEARICRESPLAKIWVVEVKTGRAGKP